jgi:hypothetical protein
MGRSMACLPGGRTRDLLELQLTWGRGPSVKSQATAIPRSENTHHNASVRLSKELIDDRARDRAGLVCKMPGARTRRRLGGGQSGIASGASLGGLLTSCKPSCLQQQGGYQPGPGPETEALQTKWGSTSTWGLQPKACVNDDLNFGLCLRHF